MSEWTMEEHIKYAFRNYDLRYESMAAQSYLLEHLARSHDALQVENKALVKAHDTQVTIAKEFQKLFREIEPEMSKLQAECQRLREALAECVETIETDLSIHYVSSEARAILEGK